MAVEFRFNPAPRIPSLDGFQVVYEQWLESLARICPSGPETFAEIGNSMEKEVMEAVQALRSGQQDSLDIRVSAEAADVIIFAVAGISNSGHNLGRIIPNGKPGQYVEDFSGLDKHADNLIVEAGLCDTPTILDRLHWEVSTMNKSLQNGGGQQRLLLGTTEAILLASAMIRSLGLSTEPVVVGKHHRNSHKYNPAIARIKNIPDRVDLMTALKNEWGNNGDNGDLDVLFIRAQLDQYYRVIK